MGNDNITKARKAIVSLGTFHSIMDAEIKATAEFDDEIIEVNVIDTIDEIVKEYISDKVGQGEGTEIKISMKESVE